MDYGATRYLPFSHSQNPSIGIFRINTLSAKRNECKFYCSSAIACSAYSLVPSPVLPSSELALF